MSIEQPRHKNAFYKGWHQDLDPLFQPEGTFRDALNMRLISDTTNSYGVESMKGTLVSFSLAVGYRPIGGVFLLDKLIIFSTNGASLSTGKIGVVTFDETGAGTYVEVYSNADLNFGYNFPIRRAIAFRENDTTERIYWTDNENAPRVINILDPSVSSIPPGILDWVPKKITGHVDYKGQYLTGSVKCGAWQFFYRLKDTSGITTTFSYLAKPIFITDYSANVVTPNLRDYQQYQGNLSTASSGKSILLELNGIDTNYSTIEIGAFFTTAYGVTGDGFYIFSGAITGDTMEFIFGGNENLGVITQNDLVQVYTSILKCKDFDILKNRMMPANLKLVGELPTTFDPSSATVEFTEYLLPSDMMGQVDQAGATVSGSTPDPITSHKIQPKNGIASGNLMGKGKYIVKGTTGKITYNGTDYFPGDDFETQDIAGTYVRTFVATGDCIVKAILKWRKYGLTESRIIELNDDYYDFKGVAASKYLKSLWRNETYRVGILPIDLFGNPLYVRWIADVLVPDTSTTSPVDMGLVVQQLPNNDVAVRSVGLKISGLDLTAIADQISGFCIVRVPRDAQILHEGMAWPMRQDGGSPAQLYTQATIHENGDLYYPKMGGMSLYYSPDVALGFNGGLVFQAGDKIRPEIYYTPQTGNYLTYLETPNHHYCEKYYYDSRVYSTPAPGTGAAGAQVGTIDTVRGIFVAGAGSVNAGFYSFDGTLVFNNNSDISASGAVNAILGSVNAEGRHGDGSNCGVIFTTNFVMGDIHKALISYIRPKGVLYGGNTDAAKANSQYIFCEHYQEINASVFADNGNSWVFDNIEVFGGDTFVSLYDVARAMKQNSLVTILYSDAMVFPVQSNVNPAYRKGRHISRDRSYENDSGTLYNLNGVGIDNGGNGGLEEYIYNSAYSHEENVSFYPALPIGTRTSGVKETMVRYSELKFNGELIDNFRKFLPNNFKEVNGKYGEINNVIAEKDRLYYLQNKAVGFLPVGERVSISDPTSGQMQVGEGGIMTRFDEISTFYGNQHQFSLTKMRDGFCWFDMRNRAFMVFQGDVVDLSKLLGIKSFFQHNPLFVINPLNANNILNSDNPIMGYGISGGYNSDFGDITMVFNNLDMGSFTVVFNDRVNEFRGAFLGKSSVISPITMGTGSLYISATPVKKSIRNTTVYAIGDEVTDYAEANASNYVCILAYTSGSPATAPNLDLTHWAKTSQKNQIHVNNVGDVCKFYGVVYDNYIDIIIAPGADGPILVDNVELIGNDNYPDNPFSDYDYSNSSQSAADLAIDGITVNKNYRLINKIWCSNIPKTNIGSNGLGQRLVDTWLRLKLRKDNKLSGSPIVSKNKITKLVSLTSYFRPVR